MLFYTAQLQPADANSPTKAISPAAGTRGNFSVLQTSVFRLLLYPAAAMVVHMPEVYQRDFEDLQGQFVRLFSEVTEAFKKNKSVTAKKLKKFLSYYPDLEASLVNVHSISDMMRILKNHSTFICCSRLKNVAEHFKIYPVTEKIKVYFQYLEDFCSRKLTKHIYLKPFITAESMEFAPPTTLTFKLEWNPDDKTLSDIQGVLRQAFYEHSVYVHIVVVRGGSVRVICCAPQYLMTELVRLAQKNRELLVESSVTYLRVGDTIVVDTSDQNEVRICYHRNCVTFDFHHQISLIEDLVLQLTIALQLKGEKLGGNCVYKCKIQYGKSRNSHRMFHLFFDMVQFLIYE